MSVDKDVGAGMVKTIVGEIAAMEYAGDVKAIAAVVLDRDGDVRVLTAFSEGTKLPIVAGAAILQRHILDNLAAIQKSRD